MFCIPLLLFFSFIFLAGQIHAVDLPTLLVSLSLSTILNYFKIPVYLTEIMIKKKKLFAKKGIYFVVRSR